MARLRGGDDVVDGMNDWGAGEVHCLFVWSGIDGFGF